MINPDPHNIYIYIRIYMYMYIYIYIHKHNTSNTSHKSSICCLSCSSDFAQPSTALTLLLRLQASSRREVCRTAVLQNLKPRLERVERVERVAVRSMHIYAIYQNMYSWLVDVAGWALPVWKIYEWVGRFIQTWSIIWGQPPLKNMRTRQLGWLFHSHIFPIDGNIEFMFQSPPIRNWYITINHSYL